MTANLRSVPDLTEAPDLVDLVDVGCDEAGAALLGAALHGSEDAAHMLRQLELSDLTDTKQRVVLESMQLLLRLGRPIDPVVVLGLMRASGTEVQMPATRDAGVYLADVMEWAGVASPEHYLRVIWEHALRRITQAAGVRIMQAASHSVLDEIPALVEADYDRVMQASQRLEELVGTYSSLAAQ